VIIKNLFNTQRKIITFLDELFIGRPFIENYIKNDLFLISKGKLSPFVG